MLLDHGQLHNLIVLFSHYGSYLSGLGLDLLNTIPKHGKSFRNWLADMRQHLDETIEVRDNCELDKNKVTITREVPCTDLFTKWIYTIDLNRLVFHIDSSVWTIFQITINFSTGLGSIIMIIMPAHLPLLWNIVTVGMHCPLL